MIEFQCWQVFLYNYKDFYTSNHFVTSHYPLMVISGTKYIFGKRIRRLRKMVAFDNSSDG